MSTSGEDRSTDTMDLDVEAVWPTALIHCEKEDDEMRALTDQLAIASVGLGVKLADMLRNVELAFLPHPNYVASQPALNWTDRGALMDWLAWVHADMKLSAETLFCTVNMVDRFLSQRQVGRRKLRHLGVTCLSLASKTEEIMEPSSFKFAEYEGDCCPEDLERYQKYVKKTLGSEIRYPDPTRLLRQMCEGDEDAKAVGEFLMVISTVEHRLLRAPPSLVAAAAVWTAHVVLGKEERMPDLTHEYSWYTKAHMIATAEIMVDYVRRPIRHGAIWEKYATKKYRKASTIVRNWALAAWPEGTQVSLEDHRRG
ncbi:hypothetical protein OE88DRAFT_1737047 [Heliocybe sulcata]|uniref:Uncharacterized protein n=1 Tax=Heliocybe sulcata TaxID=5364 RepID=A0A5C3MX40_9AGAM|nr:hypothetical protein OE88DRAFT_1737047 [Heliocybe sulcata]